MRRRFAAVSAAAARTAQKFRKRDISGSGYEEHCETQGFEKGLTK